MNNIGNIKSRLLGKLTEAYTKQEKNEIKDIINLIRENKKFVELYLFYEEIEKKYIDNQEIAKQYVEEIIPILKLKTEGVLSFCHKLNKKLGVVTELHVPIYDDLDVLVEEDNLSNIDKKLISKKNLLEHLTTKKEIDTIENGTPFVQNESLYYALLVNNFNVLYENELTNEEKNELSEFISISDKEIKSRIEDIREDVLDKISKLLLENSDEKITQKLEDVKNEVNRLTPTRYNLYKVQQLKNGLI